MSLNAGTRLGPYEIVAPLGAGGMGEVYRARDTRLHRDVAIKALTTRIADDPQSRARFQREARAVAALNHPHICTLHDVGSEHGTDFLVMEYLEGETLADRVTRGPMALDQALPVAREICDALDRAHRAGIVHRDLKPSNVMLTKAGVKLLDFGLAKFSARLHGGVTAALTQTLTGEGMLTGTVPYMAPEQLEGREADARSDLFAFGAVLYEMVTGQRAFVGESRASVIAAILEHDPPPVSTLRPMTPPALDRLVRTCLAKDPDNRWQTARDLLRELTWIADGKPQETAHAPVSRRPWRHRERVAWSAGIVLLLALAVWLGVSHTGSTSQATQVVRAPLLPPSESSFLPYVFATSPDGTRVTFASAGPDGNAALWVRALSGANARPLKGTEGPAAPFWSPDSRHIGFFADGKLKTVDIGDGSVEILGEAPAGFGGTWNRDGTIVFGPSPAGPLYRVSQAGGVVAPVTKILTQGSGQGHRFPVFLPDGTHFLYFVRSPNDAKNSGIYVSSLDSSVVQRVAVDSTENATFATFASGRLLYVRGRSLMAQPFNLDRLEPTGPAVTIADGVETDVGGRPEFSVSANGVLVFQAEAPPSQLVWYDGSGKELGLLPFLGSKYPRFSPDGRFLAVSSDDSRNGKYHVHTYDLTRDIDTRLTDGRSSDQCPIWSRDGKEITYASTDGAAQSILTIPVDRSDAPRVQLRGARMVPNDWSPDGHLAFMDFSRGRPRLAIYSASDQMVAPWSGESEAQFSPDGNWIAYAGTRGRLSGEIIVQHFPGPGGSLQISTAGGGQPRWSRDGKRIYYLAPDKKLMAVAFDSQSMTASTPQVLFQTRIVSFGYDFSQYDVAPDGRFLINSLPASFSSPLTLVTEWTALLKEHASR